MSLKIHSVINGSLASQEYVWLVTSEAVNLKGYAIVDRTFTENGQLSNEFRHIFVFPEQAVGKNDLVRLYTVSGRYNKEMRSNGTGYIHNFYWGSSHPVWNNNGKDFASLIKYNAVNSIPVPAVK